MPYAYAYHVIGIHAIYHKFHNIRIHMHTIRYHMMMMTMMNGYMYVCMYVWMYVCMILFGGEGGSF